MFKTVVQTTRKSLETTSIRGVPRIFKSDTSFLRILWIVFTFSSTIFLLYNVYTLTTKYLNYETMMIRSERVAHAEDFPTISFCYILPFNFNKENFKALDHINPLDYSKNINILSWKLLQEGHFNEAFRVLQLDTISNYFQTIFSEDETSFTMSHDAVECTYLSESKSGNCTIESFLINDHAECYGATIPKDEIEDSTVVTLAIQFELARSIRPNLHKSFKTDFASHIKTLGSQMRFLLHPRNTFPKMKDGFDLELNKSSYVLFSSRAAEYLATPNEPCDKDPNTFISKGIAFKSYYAEECKDLHKQKSVMESCSCIDASLPFPEENPDKLPFCGMLDFDAINVTLSRLNCSRDVAKTKEKIESHKECRHACHTVVHKVDFITSLTTMTKSRALRFMEEMQNLSPIIKTECNENFNSSSCRCAMGSMRYYLLNDRSGLCPSSRSKPLVPVSKNETGSKIPNAINTGSTSDLSETERFSLWATLKRHSNIVVVDKSELRLSLTAFFSQIGGLCSLCLGLTTCVLAEIIEFIFRCWKNSKETSSKKKEAPRRPSTIATSNDIFGARHEAWT